MSPSRLFALLAVTSCGLDAPGGEPIDSADQGLSGAGILGWVDSVQLDGDGEQLHVRGWACDDTVSASVKVHVYVNGSAFAGGTFLAAGTANGPREAAVSAACHTSGVAHGFDVAIGADALFPHVGQTLWVHGISLTGRSNLALGRSGGFAVPLPSRTVVKLSEKLATLRPPYDLMIAADETVTIDTDADLGLVMVNGRLRCPNQPVSVTLKAEGIMVHGSAALFDCGSEAARFPGHLRLELKDGRQFSAMEGRRALSVMNGGTLRLWGQAKNFGWQRIRGDVAAGDLRLRVGTPVDWSPGDAIVLGPTGMSFSEAEQRTVASVSADGQTIEVTRAFSFAHNGTNHPFSQGTRTWWLDDRAEVANLTRNIVVTSAGDPAALDAAQLGAHVMVMKTGHAYVDGVELERGGQLGVLGRYPFHWHLAGEVSGQFIRNSSIHHTYQRCVTIHGTNGALVQNNVCFDHFGHGFFLENGNEVNNWLVGNLGMKSKRVPAGKGLLVSDMRSNMPDRFQAPATFWITNPKNVVVDNVASGSQGTGFWMSFSQSLYCPPDASCHFAASGGNVFPAREATLAFAHNVAHSAFVGINWDGTEDGPLANNPLNPNARELVNTHYAPPAGTEPSFADLTVFRNVASGIYFRGNAVRFPRLIAADNGFSMFFAYNQKVSDALIVGISPALTAADLHYAGQVGGYFALLEGIRLYDGPFELDRVHFAGFTTMQVDGRTVEAVPFVNIGGAGRWVNRVNALTFDPQPIRRIAFDGAAATSLFWLDARWTTAIRDVDGSLGGVAGRTLVASHPINALGWVCPQLSPSVGNGFSCAYDLGILSLAGSGMSAPYDMNHIPFVVTRVEEATGAMVQTLPASWLSSETFNSKAGLIMNRGQSYRLDFPLVRPNPLRLTFVTEQVNALSPIVQLAGVGPGCSISSSAPVGSLEQLRAATGPAHFAFDTSLYVRLQARFPSDKGGAFSSAAQVVSCP